MLEIPVLGMIPEDIKAQNALKQKNALVLEYPHSPPARAYKEIAANLAQIAYDSKKDKEKFLEKLKNRFKKSY